MQERKHRLLSLFMALTIMLAMLPLGSTTVLAAWNGSIEISDWYGNGTATDYYIDTAAKLAGLAVVVNGTVSPVDGFTGRDGFSGKTITLAVDIDLTGTTDWTPVGTFSNPFSGTFNGAGHKITGLKIGSPSTKNNTLNALGLFGSVNTTAVIRDTGVDVAIYSAYGDDSSSAYIGGLAGYNAGTVTGCHSTGSVTGGYKSDVGGLIGHVGDFSGNGTISNCYSTCDVASNNGASAVAASSVGGLVGYNERTTITNSHATGNVTCGSGNNSGQTANAGGFAGTSYLGTITNCYAKGSVTAGDLSLAGGFSGYNDGTIKDCYAEGVATGGAGSGVGGFTGYNSSTISGANIINCHSIGDATSGDCTADNSESYAGGFVARNYGGIQDCYATGKAKAGSATASSDSGKFSVYAGGFAAYTKALYGSITNCYATGTAAAENATISGSYSSSSAFIYVGGFAGYIDSVPLDNCHSLGAAAAGNLSVAGAGNTGGIYAGGFAGYVYGYKSGSVNGTVTNSYSRGSATAGANATIGGFAGGSYAESRWSYDSYTIIANSYSTGGATGSSSTDIGGFVGHNYYGAIQNCYEAGLVTSGGSTNAGGFAGNNEAYGSTALIENAYYNNTLNAAVTGIGLNTGTDHTAGLSSSIMKGAAASIPYSAGSGPATAASFVDALNGGISLLDSTEQAYRFWEADNKNLNNGYPVFIGSWQDSGNVSDAFAGGAGTQVNPYRIATASQLAYLAKLLNNSSTKNTYKALYYILTADIDLGGKQWEPIGKSDNYGYTFAGSFDGGGHRIIGLTIGTAALGDTSLSYTGLFGYIGSGAVIKNVGVNVEIHSGNNGGTVGGLAAYNGGTIQNCYATGSIEGGDNSLAGGLAGYSQGTIQNCYASVLTSGGSGSNIGGFLGADNTGTVQNAYFDGSAAQTVNGSPQAPKKGIGISTGTVGSTTELSSGVMTGTSAPNPGITYYISSSETRVTNTTNIAFVDALNGGISLLGNESLYMPWSLDSNTSPINGGYPVLGTAASPPTTANASNNTVSVNPTCVTAGSSTTITATGDRQSVAGAVYGDERYIPTTWTSTEAGKNGTFTVAGSTYASSYTPSSAGSYTITATFQKQTWDGSTWSNAAGSTDIKTTSLTVTAASTLTAASGSNNTVSASPASVIVGGTTTITAAGDRQSVAGAVYGDERYIPTAWTSTEAGKNGTFTLSGGNYTSGYTTSSTGSYTITATFQKQTWDGSAWNNVAGSTDTKTASLTVTAASVPTTANGSNNTVSASPASVIVGSSTTITAAGDRQSVAGAVYGDERYIPTTWASTEAGKNGTFTLAGGNYTSIYTPSSAGSYTITATFQKQTWDGSAWNDAAGSTDTKTVSLTVSIPGGSNGGGGSSGGSSNTGNTTATETSQTSLGRVTTQNGAATATVDPAKLAKEISENKPGSTIVFAITGNVNKAAFNLSVDDLKAIAVKGSMLQLESPLGIYKLPAAEIDFDGISKQYPNISYKDIKVTITFSIVDGTKAKLDGSKLVGQPVSITVSLTAGDKVIELDEFTKYVERDLPVPDGSGFTTGVVIEKDGTLRHVPTKTAIVNGKKYAAIFSRTNSVYCLISKAVSFDDLEGHWAKEAVNDMASRLIISGVGNSKFEPGRDITRAEFAAIVIRALGLKTADSAGFTDVKSGNWYYGVVAAAYKYGIVSGYGDGTFKSDNKITRQEAMAMIARAMKVAGMDTTITNEAAATELAKFIDGGNFSDWARQTAAVVIRSGLVVGSEGYARPERNITRAETAMIVRRLLEKAGLI